MTIGNIIKKNVFSIKEDATIKQAAELMKKNNIGSVMIFNEKDEIKGILTDRDIVIKIICAGKDYNNTKVTEGMSTDLLLISSDQGIKKAIEEMKNKGVRRAPITENNKICGIVSMDELIIMLASEFSNLANLVSNQIES